MLSSAVRLFIHIRFNPTVRKELETMFCCVRHKYSAQYGSLVELTVLTKETTDADGTSSTSFSTNTVRRKSAYHSSCNLVHEQESLHQNGMGQMLSVKDALSPRRKSATTLLLFQNEIQAL